MITVCRAAHIAVGINAEDVDSARYWIEHGIQLIAYSSDLGMIRSQVNAEPVRVYREGESFFEDLNSLHAISENASETEPARLLAVFVADDGASLTTFDQ